MAYHQIASGDPIPLSLDDFGDYSFQNRVDGFQSMVDDQTRQFSDKIGNDFDNLVMMGQEKRAQTRRKQDATLAALMRQADSNNGFVPYDVLEAASQNLGIPVAGGNYDKDGNFYLYTMDQHGRMKPLAIADHGMQLKTLQRAHTWVDGQRALWNKLSEKYTPDQMTKFGYKNPASPTVDGSTTMSGSVYRALKGLPRERSVTGVFSNIGGDGWVGTGTHSETIDNRNGTRSVIDTGTRRDDWQGNWKVISSGPAADATYDHVEQVQNADGTYSNVNVKGNYKQETKYRNNKTGEVITVPDGESIQSVLSGNTKEKIEAKRNANTRIGRTYEEQLALDEARRQGQLDLAEAKAKSQQELESQKQESRKSLAADKNKEAMRLKLAGITNPYTRQPIFSDDEINARLEKIYGKQEIVPPMKVSPIDTESKLKESKEKRQVKASNGDNNKEIDLSTAKTKAEKIEKLRNAPEGARATINGVTKTKRNGQWVDERK